MWETAIAILLTTQADQSLAPPPPPPLHGGPAEITCPIGGERFEALMTTSYSTTGRRPDGKPYSYWPLPIAIPVCPSNGLVVFQDFTPEQIATLKPLIASDAYKRMIKQDSTYYRAQWLATRIGVPEADALPTLLQATWQVKPSTQPTGQAMQSPDKARAYQEEFVRRVRALPSRSTDVNYHAAFARAANAERELGHFREAAAMIDQLRDWLPADDPEGWRQFAEELAVVVKRRDASAEPLDMLDDQEAVYLCANKALPATAFNRSFCDAPERRAAVAEYRRMVDPSPSRTAPAGKN